MLCFLDNILLFYFALLFSVCILLLMAIGKQEIPLSLRNSQFVLSCLVLSDSSQPMDCSPPDTPVHGIFQAGIQKWVAISSSRGSSPPGDRMHISWVSCMAGRFLPSVPPGKTDLENNNSSCFLTFVVVVVLLKFPLVLFGNPQHN